MAGRRPVKGNSTFRGLRKAADARYVTDHFDKGDHRDDRIAPAEQDCEFSPGYTGNSTGGEKGTGAPAATPDPKLIDTITYEFHTLRTGFLEEVGADIPGPDDKRKRSRKSDNQALNATIENPRDTMTPTNGRPNILFISVDDLNDWIGCLGGHPQAKTPNIDRLASSGMLFTNAHCAAPACNPSRTAIMTGISPHKSGLYSNRQKMRELLPDAELLPAVLFAAWLLVSRLRKDPPLLHRCAILG